MYTFTTNLLHIISKILFKVKVEGLENIPDEGRIILAANHKSNWDPVFIAGTVRKRKLVGIAKKELNNNKIVAFFIKKLGVITIDRDKPEITSVKKVLKALKEESAVVIFPEGTRVKGEGFGEAKQGTALFALKGQSNIIPISIITNYKLFSKVHIYIDKPICLEQYFGKKITTEDKEHISKDIMDKIKENYLNNISFLF